MSKTRMVQGAKSCKGCIHLVTREVEETDSILLSNGEGRKRLNKRITTLLCSYKDGFHGQKEYKIIPSFDGVPEENFPDWCPLPVVIFVENK
jgi:hypothetical protein